MPGQRWKPVEKDQLREQIAERLLAIADVSISGRNANAVRSQALRMGLIQRGPSRTKWSSKQKQRLKKLKQEGLTPLQIFQFGLLGEPHRSLWSITKKWGRMKLADRKRSRQMKRKKIWQAGERPKFDAFLRKHSRSMTPEEIGKIWQVARSTVARRQTELGVKVPREQVMQMVYSLNKQKRARQRIRRENTRNWARRRQAREAQLLQYAEKLRSQQRPPEEQTCSDCDTSFPKRKEFFHTTEKKISIGRSRYFKRRCVLCENARRREIERKKRRRRRA